MHGLKKHQISFILCLSHDENLCDFSTYTQFTNPSSQVKTLMVVIEK